MHEARWTPERRWDGVLLYSLVEIDLRQGSVYQHAGSWRGNPVEQFMATSELHGFETAAAECMHIDRVLLRRAFAQHVMTLSAVQQYREVQRAPWYEVRAADL